jgi:hypothetical protein
LPNRSCRSTAADVGATVSPPRGSRCCRCSRPSPTGGLSTSAGLRRGYGRHPWAIEDLPDDRPCLARRRQQPRHANRSCTTASDRASCPPFGIAGFAALPAVAAQYDAAIARGESAMDSSAAFRHVVKGPTAVSECHRSMGRAMQRGRCISRRDSYARASRCPQRLARPCAESWPFSRNRIASKSLPEIHTCTCTQEPHMDARGDEAQEEKHSFRRVCVALRPGASPCGNAEKKPIPSTGIRGSRSRPRKTVVFGGRFLKSTHVSAQTVALRGCSLQRRTLPAFEEGDGTHGLVGLSTSAAARTHAGRVSRWGGYKFSLCS